MTNRPCWMSFMDFHLICLLHSDGWSLGVCFNFTLMFILIISVERRENVPQILYLCPCGAASCLSVVGEVRHCKSSQSQILFREIINHTLPQGVLQYLQCTTPSVLRPLVVIRKNSPKNVLTGKKLKKSHDEQQRTDPSPRTDRHTIKSRMHRTDKIRVYKLRWQHFWYMQLFYWCYIAGRHDL